VELRTAQERLDAEVQKLEREDLGDNEKTTRRARATRIQDPQLRSAVETHAVDAAVDYYTELGATEIVKVGKPYDIRLLYAGQERHIEVKGSSLSIEAVELTVNEVNHAQDHQPTDLVVVDGIEWSRADGQLTTSGGRLRVWLNWTPHREDLSPRKFAYSLPTARRQAPCATRAPRDRSPRGTV
jgi:hypothetical protein